MKLICAHDGKLQTLTRTAERPREKTFTTGLRAIDELCPNQSFARGAIHELLSNDRPEFFAAVLARSSSQISNFKPQITIWSDPRGEIYPPALAALGFDLANVYLLRTKNAQDELWAITQCLRCRGVAAVIAAPNKLSRIEARRLQLAAEVGGTVGILLRDPRTTIYAAATRWLVEPCPGERNVQRWKVQLIHGHGGQTQKVVFLEHCRETNSVRAALKLADRSASPLPKILSA